MPLYCAISTRLGSIRISFTSVGVARISSEQMMALTHTLLPDPVAPAISTCGIFDRSALNGWPATSWPSAKASLLVAAHRLEVARAEHLLERDQIEGAVRDLDADVRLAGDRRLDPDGARRQAQRQVVGQALDPRQLDARLHVQRVLGDDRTLLDARHLHADPEMRQRLLDPLALGGQVELRGAAGRAHRPGARAPGGPRRARSTPARHRASSVSPTSARCCSSSVSSASTLTAATWSPAPSPPRAGHGRRSPAGDRAGRRRPGAAVEADAPSGRARRTISGGSSSSAPTAQGGPHRSRMPRLTAVSAGATGIGSVARLASSRLARLGCGQLVAILTALQPGRDQVADRHVEVQQHADHEQQRPARSRRRLRRWRSPAASSRRSR